MVLLSTSGQGRLAKGSGLASYLGEMCALTTLTSQFSTARYFRSNGGGAKSSCALRRVGSHNCANLSPLK